MMILLHICIHSNAARAPRPLRRSFLHTTTTTLWRFFTTTMLLFLLWILWYTVIIHDRQMPVTIQLWYYMYREPCAATMTLRRRMKNNTFFFKRKRRSVHATTIYCTQRQCYQKKTIDRSMRTTTKKQLPTLNLCKSVKGNFKKVFKAWIQIGAGKRRLACVLVVCYKSISISRGWKHGMCIDLLCARRKVLFISDTVHS